MVPGYSEHSGCVEFLRHGIPSEPVLPSGQWFDEMATGTDMILRSRVPRGPLGLGFTESEAAL
jgi:hypothetical protein